MYKVKWILYRLCVIVCFGGNSMDNFLGLKVNRRQRQLPYAFNNSGLSYLRIGLIATWVIVVPVMMVDGSCPVAWRLTIVLWADCWKKKYSNSVILVIRAVLDCWCRRKLYKHIMCLKWLACWKLLYLLGLIGSQSIQGVPFSGTYNLNLLHKSEFLLVHNLMHF